MVRSELTNVSSSVWSGLDTAFATGVHPDIFVLHDHSPAGAENCTAATAPGEADRIPRGCRKRIFSY